MLKLILHHTYNNGRATDVSGHDNHGVALRVTSVGSSLRLLGGASEIRVPPSPSLAGLNAVRVRLRFRWEPSQGANLRTGMTLVKGDASFFIFVTKNRRLHAGILDASGVMNGVLSEAVIDAHRWHELEFRHDGMASAQMVLDGQLVAQRDDIQGPVRSVGPGGIVIGRWDVFQGSIEPPNPEIFDPNLFGFVGQVDDFRLDKEYIDRDGLLDPCCNDGPTLGQAIRSNERSPDGAKPRAVLVTLRALESQVRAQAIAGDPTRSARIRGLATRGGRAIAEKRLPAALAIASEALQFLRERMTQQEIEAFQARAIDAIEATPQAAPLARYRRTKDAKDLEPFRPLAAALCRPLPTDGQSGPPVTGETLGMHDLRLPAPARAAATIRDSSSPTMSSIGSRPLVPSSIRQDLGGAPHPSTGAQSTSDKPGFPRKPSGRKRRKHRHRHRCRCCCHCRPSRGPSNNPR